MSPRIKFCWCIVSLFASFFKTVESFVVFPSTGFKSGRQTMTSASSAMKTLLFERTENSDDDSPMEFRSIPNKPFQNEHKYNVSLLVIDHYDSFTYNLWDMLAQLTVEPPVVVAKDAIDASKTDMALYFEQFDGIVLSPGPGTPQEQPPLSHLAISENPDIPILGVCLGHQLMSLVYGARVERAPIPIHGQDHQIIQTDPLEDCEESSARSIYPSLLKDLPSSFRVVRYHSLCAYDLPSDLSVTARSRDNVVQAIQHASSPHYGVQFHPESIGTENGMALLENFVRVVEGQKNDDIEILTGGALDRAQAVKPTTTKSVGEIPEKQSNSRFRVMVHRFPSQSVTASPLRIFEKFYARESHTIWLDSSSYHTGRGELDIMSAPSRSDDILEYHIDENNNDNVDILSRLEHKLFGGKGGTISSSTDIGWVNIEEGESSLEWGDENDKDENVEELPFNYRGGFLGFLGYEVRHDTQRYLQQLEGSMLDAESKHKVKKADDSNSVKDNRIPTAAFFLARQSMVYHHPTNTWYLVAIAEEDADVEENLGWMKLIDLEIRNLSTDNGSEVEDQESDFSQSRNKQPIEFVPNRPKETYKDDVAKCHEYIKKGDSYELCLTNQLEAQIKGPNISTFDLYKTIRKKNPAPYSSYFRWNMLSTINITNNYEEKAVDLAGSTSLAICSSSPERFMSISKEQPHPEVPSFLQAEAKPIKGTCARVMPKNGISLSEAERREDERRARSLELSLKNRAENLMIVDLLRNDMSRVCKTGSVHVSKLMDIESFATVHQMVSTIRGTLSDSSNSIDLLRASFPGGSMTGAPKIRTMEILEELEENVDRGPYSGSLGYLSVNGCMDMNIMIRSATVTLSDKKDEWKVRIGAGGAITALSEAEDEYDEMLLKARAVKEAVQEWALTIDNDDTIDSGRGATISNEAESPVFEES